jgi:hypothetical protein
VYTANSEKQDGGPKFCEAEKRKIFTLRKIIVQGKTLKKI